MTTVTTTPDWDADLQVYEPHRAGLPKMRPYFRDLFGRLEFAAEFSRSGIKAAHSQTVFGQLWLVLNPLLLACVYYLLVAVIGNRDGIEYLAHITGGLFVFNLVAGSLSSGAGSVTGGGRLIMNQAFPRMLMPLAAVRTAFFRFMPTLVVYFVIKVLSGTPWNWAVFGGVYFLAMLTVFSLGVAAIMGTLQVYFRDTTSFLPFFTRIWLYGSPVLWTVHDKAAVNHFTLLLLVNPLFSMIGGWTQTTLLGEVPEASLWLVSAGWAFLALIVGTLFFMSRERDFAVRL